MAKLHLNESPLRNNYNFDEYGTHSSDPNQKRSNYKYYNSDLDIDGTVEELWNDVVNNYVLDEEALRYIKEILIQNKWDEEAKIIDYYIDEIEEEKQYGDDYSINRMKIDIADDYSHAGFDDVSWDSYKLSCYYDVQSQRVVIELTDNYNWETDADAIPVEKFMNMTRKDFENWVGELSYYGNFEPNGGFPEDEE